MKNGGHTALVCLETGIKIPFLEIDKMWWDRSPKLKKLIWNTGSKWDHFNKCPGIRCISNKISVFYDICNEILTLVLTTKW